MIKKLSSRIAVTIVLLLVCLSAAMGVGCSFTGSESEYSVYFIVDSKVYAVINTNGNEIFELPDEPEKTNFTFAGWYWDKGTFEMPFTGDSLANITLSKDLSVYAKWVANEHTCVATDWITDKKATCAVAGERHKECTICGETLETETIPATGEHTESAWITDKAATCTEEGLQHKECTVCRTNLEIEPIPALKHALADVAAKAPTCTEDGWSAYKKCTREGCNYTEGYETKSSSGHTFFAVEAKAATCTAGGWTAYHECKTCGYTNDKVLLDPLGHELVDVKAKDSTCTEIGWEAYQKCDRVGCGYTVGYQTIPAKEHLYADGACTRCGEKEADGASLNVYNGRYGYNFFASTANGESKQTLYNRMDKAVKAFHNDKTINCGSDNAVETISFADLRLDKDTAVSVWKTYKDDNPLFYWLSNTLQYTENDITLLVDPDYANGAKRATANKLVYDSVKSYIARLDDGDGAYRKALAFHDYIIEAIDYAYDSNKKPQSAGWAHSVIGVFDETGAVCEGYARTFQLLLNYSGVENVFVTGKSQSADHAWNLVKLEDGNWYWYDLTYDDISGMWGIGYNYFCATDSNFVSNHTFNTSSGVAGEYLYDLPERSSASFSVDGQLLLNDEFTANYCTFAVAGYNTVELHSIGGAENVSIPETVNYGKNTYTVISVGSKERDTVIVGGIKTVFVPKTVKFIWEFAFRWHTLQSINVAEDNPKFTSVDGVLFTKSLYTLIAYPAANGWTEYTIPDETKMIAYWAFGDAVGYRKLEKLTFGANVGVVGITNWGSGYKDSDEEATGGNIVVGGIKRIIDALAGNKQIIINENNRNYSSDNFAIYDYEKTYIYGVINQYEEYEIPANISRFYSDAFSKCEKLKKFTVEEGNQYFSAVDGVLYNKDQTQIIAVPLAIEGAVAIPDGITSIDKGLFWGCSRLTSISIPNSVTTICDSAFYICDGLTSVVIGSGVASIGNNAFERCYKLKEVINYSKLTITIGSEDNGYVGYYASIVKNTGDSEIVEQNCYLFYTSDGVNYLWGYSGNATELVLPEDYNGNNYVIDDYAFSNCDRITSVVIPDSVISIGEYAFMYCNGLTSIIIPNSVTTIGDNAFMYCGGLSNVIIGDGVEVIGENAFYSCSGLTSVTVGKNVKSIGSNPFVFCHRLVEVINNSAFNIKSYVYNSVNIKVGGTSDIVNQDGYLFYSCNGKNYLVGYIGNATELVLPEKYNGSDYEINRYAFYNCSWLTSVVIPKGIKSINEGVFEGCRGLKNIKIPDSVTLIGSEAFRNCSGLTSIVIPDSVTSIGSYAFHDCGGLTSVVIPNTVTSIGRNAFQGCRGLMSITIPDNVTEIGDMALGSCTGLIDVKIGNGVTSIAKELFYGCKELTRITISSSITSIDDRAFYYCTMLTVINFEGTIEQWKAITKGNNWKNDVPSFCVIKCTDGEIGIND